MTKFIAILNVIAWSGFWAFGYIALTGGGDKVNVGLAWVLAALGAALGIFAYRMLMKIALDSGYAAPKPRSRPAQQDDNGEPA